MPMTGATRIGFNWIKFEENLEILKAKRHTDIAKKIDEIVNNFNLFNNIDDDQLGEIVEDLERGLNLVAYEITHYFVEILQDIQHEILYQTA